MEEDLYLKLNTLPVYINIMWSSNESLDPNTTGVIGIYIYDENGDEHPDIEGGELDVFDENSLKSHIPDILDFIGLPTDTQYEFISEDDFENIFYKIVDLTDVDDTEI